MAAPHEPLLDDGEIRSALVELRAAGGPKPYMHCRFGFNVMTRLTEAGLATIDDGSPQRSVVRLTTKGRALILDS